MWESIKRFFRDSETIFWARLQALMGAIAGLTMYVDPVLLEPLLSPKGFAIYVLVNGIATEYLRRRRAGDM